MIIAVDKGRWYSFAVCTIYDYKEKL